LGLKLSDKKNRKKGEWTMATPKVRCTIVEIACDHGTSNNPAAYTAKELLPWADPFIAQLVARHRLRAALDDSLRFLESEASHDVAPRTDAVAEALRRRSPRFTMPLDDEPQSGVDRWPW